MNVVDADSIANGRERQPPIKPVLTYEQRLALYEARKSQLSDDLNHHEYSCAVRQIARELGV
ncbi:hypothetical protein [uncultured Paraglaciecola sp.]|uniref:hypothetical protein n=1 Tax=uncultured Paraglaciecola sp. TaxID=1765024 RepID=UPI00261F2389|nr:hypothetical protein [uncultured Paraglaciecola sp.]